MATPTCTKRINWLAPTPLPIGYEVYYRKVGDPTYTMVFTTDTNVTLTGLDVNFQYEGYVRAKCSESLFSTIAVFDFHCMVSDVPACTEWYNNTQTTYSIGYVPCNSQTGEFVAYDIGPGQSVCARYIAGDYGWLNNIGNCSMAQCTKYFVQTNKPGGTVVHWEDCHTGDNRNQVINQGYQLVVCSRSAPTGVEIQIVGTSNCD